MSNAVVDSDRNQVRRPGIPILLPCAGACWVATAMSYTSFAGSDEQTTSCAAMIALVSSVGFLASVILTKMGSISLILLFGAIGVLLGSSGIAAYNHALDHVPDDTDWTFHLTSDPKSTDFGFSVEAEGTSSKGSHVKARLYLDDCDGLFNRAKISASADLHPIGKDKIASHIASGITATASANDVEILMSNPFLQFIHDLRASSISKFEEHGGDQAGILQALVCGYRRTINEDRTYDEFKRCGLAHVVAVSGAHLAIVAMIFGLLLSALRVRRFIRIIITSFFMISYLFFAGIPISAVRATIMVMLSISSGLFKRRSGSLGALAICVIAFLAMDPASSISASLILSAGSTLGIIIFARLFSSWFDQAPNAVKKSVGEPLALTFSSNVVTMPYSVATFSQLPLISPVANVIATPLFSIACVVGLASAIVAFINAELGAILIRIASLCALPLRLCVSILSSIQHGCIPIEVPLWPMIALTMVICIAFWRIWPQLRIKGIAAGATIAILAALFMPLAMRSAPIGDEVIMLDVGQGDCFAIRSNGSTVLIDTGNQDAKLLSAMASYGITDIDALLITHPDDDHCGSTKALCSNANVKHIAVAEGVLACPCDKCSDLVSVSRSAVGQDNVVGLSVGSTITVGSFNLKVVWPESLEDEGGNGDSLCMMVDIDCDDDGLFDWSALFTGDAEAEQLDGMISNASISDIDILKVGHHGSKASLSKEALEILNPSTALISVGSTNRYGHPSKQTLELLEQNDVDVLRTDEMGSIRLVFSKSGITVE